MTITKKNIIVSIIAVILIALGTGIYFLLPYEKTNTDNIVFMFAIATKILAYFNLIFYNKVSNKKKLALTAGGYTLTIIYLVFSAVISLLFGLYYRNAMATYKILMCGITAFFIIIDILIYIGVKKVDDKSSEVENACSFFKTLEYKIENLCLNTKDENLTKEFLKIKDAIKSCDQSTIATTDKQINQQLDLLLELINNPTIEADKVMTANEKMIALITQRNTEVQKLKAGGI